MINLYWPVYKNIEKEVLELSNVLHFDDNQLSIYSVKIAALLIRTSVEIEAISKDLYFRLGGDTPTSGDLYFDTHCLQLLEDKWCLSKKILILSSPYFYFQKEENVLLTPIYKAYNRGDSASDWKKAYQALKHNRTKNLHKANLKNLLRALGALFVLNVYYKNEKFDFGKEVLGTNFPTGLGSDIFSVKLHEFKGQDPQSRIFAGSDFPECIYLVKYTSESFAAWEQAHTKMSEEQDRLFKSHPRFKIYCESHDLNNYKGANLMLDILGEEEHRKIMAATVGPLEFVVGQSRFEAVLNTIRC